jgi:hypothetical protein
VALTNQMLMTFVTGSDPGLLNTNPPPNNLQVQTLAVTNPVSIPPYSVVRLEWQVFFVPVPLLTVKSTNSLFELSWPGLTNVNYVLQASTNFATWESLVTYSGSNTTKRYTEAPGGTFRFFRVMVP